MDCSAPTKAGRVSMRGRATPGSLQVGIMPDDATGRRVFSGISRFPRPLHSNAAPFSPHFALFGSQGLILASMGRNNAYWEQTEWSNAMRMRPTSPSVTGEHTINRSIEKTWAAFDFGAVCPSSLILDLFPFLEPVFPSIDILVPQLQRTTYVSPFGADAAVGFVDTNSPDIHLDTTRKEAIKPGYKRNTMISIVITWKELYVKLLTSRSCEQMRVVEVSIEQRRNERVGETRDPRENSPTNGIVRHHSDMRKSGVTRPRHYNVVRSGLWPQHTSVSEDRLIKSLGRSLLICGGTSKPRLRNIERRSALKIHSALPVFMLADGDVNMDGIRDLEMPDWGREIQPVIELGSSQFDSLARWEATDNEDNHCLIERGRTASADGVGMIQSLEQAKRSYRVQIFPHPLRRRHVGGPAKNDAEDLSYGRGGLQELPLTETLISSFTHESSRDLI
ncbi:hypothetical protein PR048_021219 [Dryococelus australis]|uniref:Uncharacterized protein n=1 Tax=Dryococelus australis TaxID=614101 RepID=A0ABQ9GXN3_9NEOP|nr:hypothetical protein PR048_021219 [Dryococelus australis]